MKDIAKVIWNWRMLPRQVLRDYRVHRQIAVTSPPLPQRLAEQFSLLWTNRITAKDYYKFGLFDPALPAAAKRSYIGECQPWKLMTPVNNPAYYELTDDKMKFQARALARGLPVAEILATVSPAPLGDAVPNLAGEAELGAWMTDNDVSDVVLKPIAGLMGRGILGLGERLPGEAAWRRLPDGETIGIADVWAHCLAQRRHGGMLIQRRLRPHPDLARIVPNVLHTVRVVTFLDPEPRVIDAVLRLGSGRAAADNMHAGGVPVPLNLANGICGQGALVRDGLSRPVDDHPLTGQRITGTRLPHWDEVLELACRAARAFPEQRSIGWDIGISDAGPMLVEGNWCYDLVLHEVAQRKGSLDTAWVDVLYGTQAYRNLSLGFRKRRRRPQPRPAPQCGPA